MHKFCIHLESKNWSASANFVGVIYFEIDGECFPCKDWTDFSLIVAPQWLTAMRCPALSRTIAPAPTPSRAAPPGYADVLLAARVGSHDR